MYESIKFSMLSRLLGGLGFADMSVPGSHHRFRHAQTNTVILLPHASGGWIRPIQVMAVARTLDEKGILDRANFERRLLNGWQASGAKSKRNHVKSVRSQERSSYLKKPRVLKQAHRLARAAH
jgi:predicted RNA binding protein YcfA (HicA-like mRNA interferase family)